jgi:iron-sulfur cluster assembly accessory protein
MINLSPIAADKLEKIMDEKGLANHSLRVFVSGGGCSGLSYGMTFAEAPETGDQVFEANGVKVIVDPGSFPYLNGAEIDYIDSLMGGGFRIENPNAVQSCSCGSSFRTEAGEKGKACSH